MSDTNEPMGAGSGSRFDTDGSFESPLVPSDDGDFFRRLVANTSEGLLTITEDSTIVFANSAIEDILGYTPDELIGSSKMTLIPERLRQAHAAGLEKFLRTGEKHIDWDGIELPALHKDGHEVPVLISLREHQDGEGPRLFTGLFRDLSDRKLRERRFEAVFNNTYQFTGLLEPDGTLVEANDTALSFAGVERSEIVGTPLSESPWFRSTEHTQQIARESVECARNGEYYRNEVRIQGRDQTAIIDFSVRPVTDHHDEIRWLLPEGRDITDRKTREQHLHVIHRLLRHNLRNDLNVIGGFAETLADELEDDTFREYAAEIAATTEELIDLNETAKKLADSTLEGQPRQHVVALEPALAEVIADFRERYPESTIALPDHAEATVAADDRLATVFAELVENAIEHADRPDPTVRIDVETGDETVAVSVSDNGPGIPEPERTGIFNEAPVTQIDHGSGLGLWLVELLLDEYGGSLAYDSCPVDGSRVTISLPRWDARGDPN